MTLTTEKTSDSPSTPARETLPKPSKPLKHRAILASSILPTGDSVLFRDSTFFAGKCPTPALPSTSNVLAEAYRRDCGVVEEYNPLPVHYPALGVTVKFGRKASVAEGQCLWAIHHLLGDAVCVPEVYSWTKEAEVVFIYMEYIEGETLKDRWDSLSDHERRDICHQLHLMVESMRSLEQPHGENLISSISGQRLLDLVFTDRCTPPIGPFTNVKDFHDTFVRIPFPNLDAPMDYRREHLPDDVPIVFTHGDLHWENIIITSPGEGSPRVKAIIDWEQAGWYPSYWEFCKAWWTGRRDRVWKTEYIPLFLEQFDYNHHWVYFIDFMI